MKKKGFTFNISLFLIFFLIGFTGNSKTFTLSEVESLAKNHLEEKYLSGQKSDEKITISEPKLDPRIQIKDCDSELTVNILENQNSRNINVKISCDAPSLWQIYLPIKIETQLPVLIVTTNLNKGSILDRENTDIEYISEYKIRGETLTSFDGILGAKLTRNLQKGNAIYSKNICLVCKGDKVNIIATSTTFQIKTEGSALTSGTIGEQVRIKNTRSGKIITGQVKALNKVVINL
ncbi:MAG: flagellar basal body P-ring formation chaperone FlgA [Thalassotalea sp.]